MTGTFLGWGWPSANRVSNFLGRTFLPVEARFACAVFTRERLLLPSIGVSAALTRRPSPIDVRPHPIRLVNWLMSK